VKKIAAIVLSLFLCTSCGYHLSGTSSRASAYKTVSVPYIIGDVNGGFTSQLIHQLTYSGRWTYAPHQGDLLLKVEILKTKDEEIGFSYPVQNGQINKWLVPNENRFSQLVRVELIDSKTSRTILGPINLSANVQYDYDAEFNVNNFVRFSLAQYNFQEIAKRTATIPLEKKLSVRIVEYLENAW
jgi:hypothetical protein